MKRLFFSAGMLSLLCISCNNADTKTADSMTKDSSATFVTTPDIKPTEPAVSTTTSMPDSATMMKNWAAYMTPGNVQKMMATWNGTWTADITMWDHPGAAPQKTKGATNNKMILGGRYQVSTNTATMMGMPFEGQNTLGYDNAKKIFVSSWVDNMGTGIMYLKGPWDSVTKTITLTGSMVNPATNNDESMRQTLTVIDDKTQLMQMFANGPDGKEFKTMEIKYSRK